MEDCRDHKAVKLAIENSSKFLGINTIKDFQLEAATAALLGKDVFVAKPTGSEKSLVFQLLPFAHFELQKMTGNEYAVPGFTIVISPLIDFLKRSLAFFLFGNSSINAAMAALAQNSEVCRRA